MESHNIENHFRREVMKSLDYYSTQHQESKEAIWQKIITNKIESTYKKVAVFLAIACSILLIATISTGRLYMHDHKVSTDLTTKISILNKQLDSLHFAFSTAAQNAPDTISVINEKIVYTPVIKEKKVTDTIYITQTRLVYLPEVKSDTSYLTNTYHKDTVIPEQHLIVEFALTEPSSKPSGKEKSFGFSFGGTSKVNNPEKLKISTPL